MLKILVAILTLVALSLADGPVLQTGQILSYDADGIVVTDGSVKDDGYYQTGVVRNYERSGDVVINTTTGLQWQDNESIEKQWITVDSYNAGDYRNTSGDTATTYCTKLPLDGGGWRLPTIYELRTLLDYSKYDPVLDTSVFQALGESSTKWYWSSSLSAFQPNGEWYISFSYGTFMEDHGGTTLHFVRCVRGQPFISSQLSREDDIVRDATTNLYWQDDIAVETTLSNWTDAINYCEDLDLGNYADWRLPNINELFSIVDVTQYNPAFDISFNNPSLSRSYWSSTSTDNQPSFAHGLSSYFGKSTSLYKTQATTFYTRCVRGGEFTPSTFKASPLSLVNIGNKTLSAIPGGQTSLHMTYDKGYAEFKVNSGDWIRTKSEYVTVRDGDTLTLRAITPAKATDGIMNLALDDDSGFKVEYTLETNSSKEFYYTSDEDEDFIPDAWEELGYVPIDSNDDGDVDTFWDFDADRTDFITTDNKPQKGRKDLYLWIDQEVNLKNQIKSSGITKMVKSFKDNGVFLHILQPSSQSVMLNPGSVNPNFIRYDDLENNGEIIHDLPSENSAYAIGLAMALASKTKPKLFYVPSEFSSVRESIYNYMLVGYRYSDNENTRSSGIARSHMAPDNNSLIFVASNIVKSERKQNGTVMHEYGHSLGLGHGGPFLYQDSTGEWFIREFYGDDDDRYNYNRNYKPHYLSIMNYNYQMGYIYDTNGDDILDYQSCVPQVKILDEDALDETENFLSNLTCRGSQVYKIKNNQHTIWNSSWGTISSTDDRINWNDSFIDIEDIVKININKTYDGNFTKLTVQDNDWTNLVLGYGRIDLLDKATPVLSSLSHYHSAVPASTRISDAIAQLPEIREEPISDYPEEYGFYLNASFSDIWAVPGSDASLSATLYNSGLNDDTYQIEARSDNNWTILIQESATLKAGESTVIPLEVDVPVSTPDGTVETIHVTASSNTRNKTESVDLRLIVTTENTNDRDGDGISDTVEEEVGTNPDSSDSDNDGIDDQNDEYPDIAEDKSPDSFTFLPALTDKTSTWVESNSHTISGINVPVTVNVQDAEYSIDGAEFTGTTGSIEVGQTLKLRVLSSIDSNTTVSGKVFVEGFSTIFEVSTDEYSCGPLEMFKQGTQTCISAQGYPSPGIYLPNCESGRLIQGTDTCDSTATPVYPTELFLPTCGEGERLIQGSTQCMTEQERCEALGGFWDGTHCHG